MSELERSPEIESEIIREAVQRVRLKDVWCQKKYGEGLDGRINYWDADNARHDLGTTRINMRTSFGEEIIFTGDPTYRHPTLMIFHVNSLVCFQFLDQDNLRDLFRVYKIFKEDTCIEIGKFENPDLECIRQYCWTMDETIRKEAEKVRSLGVTKDIFLKFWQDMGGDQIQKTDRLGNRLWFFKELVRKFKANKELWKQEMVRMKLIVA